MQAQAQFVPTVIHLTLYKPNLFQLAVKIPEIELVIFLTPEVAEKFLAFLPVEVTAQIFELPVEN